MRPGEESRRVGGWLEEVDVTVRELVALREGEGEVVGGTTSGGGRGGNKTAHEGGSVGQRRAAAERTWATANLSARREETAPVEETLVHGTTFRRLSAPLLAVPNEGSGGEFGWTLMEVAAEDSTGFAARRSWEKAALPARRARPNASAPPRK